MVVLSQFYGRAEELSEDPLQRRTEVGNLRFASHKEESSSSTLATVFPETIRHVFSVRKCPDSLFSPTLEYRFWRLFPSHVDHPPQLEFSHLSPTSLWNLGTLISLSMQPQCEERFSEPRDITLPASLRTLTLCLDQLLNRESEETITYDGDEPAAHFFSQLESQPNFHNLEPARQARKALSSLRGEPRKIAQDLALLNKTYEEVKESLCAVYPRRPSFTLQEFYELKCTSMAEIETYYKNKGIAGVLKQVHPDGNIYPVQYYSRALRSYERNYTISELECLAIVECVDKFRVYLLGTRFVIYSDHHALQWLKTIKDPTGRLFRWSLRLSAYDYEVKYLKGSRQYEAELLSRNPFCGFLSTGQIKDHQGELRRDTRYILNDKDLMTIIRRGVTKIIVPPSLRGTLLQRAHRDFNHPGISQMTRLIAAQYYWDGMTNDIRTHVRTCSVCQLVKPPKGPIYGELGQLPPAVLPYELVSLDTISGFAKYGNSQTCLHVVVDHTTRYAWAFPSRSTSILTYTQVIKKVMQFGSPKRLLTDRAPAFTSPKFRRFLIRHNIGQLLTTSNNPQANGLSERLNATITGKLKLLRLQQPKTAWTKLLPQVLQAYNHTPHSVTGFPPSYLLLGPVAVHVPSCTPKPEAAAVQVPVRSPRPQRARKPLDRLEY
ncbi:hypothetical protein LAZ67_2000659 [Cordylochernes scorpioides]|uniref:RNA-directed DNA polymerase n=1 Tax=Cordylochernes scorpioides TaxID=51811 RepID=A0ABY6K1X3_9ARAC|nr:hypothetical protein LAZ67_2000659 [Cordylochernes scorpioides]